MDWNDLFKTSYDIFLGIGAFLGFVSVALSIKKEITGGPKISLKIRNSKYVLKSTKVTTVVNDKEITELSATFSVSVQIENTGTELTSLVIVNLILRNGQTYLPKLTKHAKLIGFAGPSRLESLPYRASDERVLAIQPGTAIVEVFQFDVTSDGEFAQSEQATIAFEFVNHKKIEVELKFDRKSS